MVKLYYLMDNLYACYKYTAFEGMYDCPDKDIKFLKWSCVLHCCSKFPGVFVSDEKMKGDEDMDL